MSIVKFGRRYLSFLMILALFTAFALPAYAADSSTATALDIRLKLGSTQMSVNGTVQTVQAPFQKNGATYIPLSVLTKGFGAKLQLQSNKILTLTYGGHKVILTIGDKTLVADGKKVTLAAAPVVVNGVTMLPLRVVESFGAKVVFTAATKEIRITGNTAPAASGGNTGVGGIDSDAGKSRIGDSFYQWSMNYPTGLVQSYQSTDGDALEFRDIKKEYYLGVFVEAAADKLTPTEIRNKIFAYYYDNETTVNKQTVTKNGTTYESITTKDKDGYYYEYRGLQANSNLYVIAFGKKAASVKELASYTSILDSFNTSFNVNDTKLKDLTQIIEGYKTFSYEDYGLTLKLPKEWSAAEKANYPYYSPKDQNAYVYADITSLEAGDTTAAWVDRKMQRFKDAFAEPYRKVLEQTTAVWNGLPVTIQKITYSTDTKNWWEEYEIFGVQGAYRYYVEFAYMSSSKTAYESILGTLQKTLEFNYGKVESSFGQITDDLDMADRTATTTRTSRKYGYSVTMPQFWTGVKSDMESDDVDYYFSGGDLEINLFDNMDNAQQFNTMIDSANTKYLSENSDVRIVENSTVTFAGQPARKVVFEVDGSKGRSPSRDISYYVYYNGKGYIIEGYYLLANASDFNVSALTKAMNSFTFNP